MAVFDVLGYRQVIRNDALGEVVVLIRDKLFSLPAEIVKCVEGMPSDGHNNAETFQRIAGTFNWALFSDTILLTLELSEKQNTQKEIEASYWIAFLTVCRELHRWLFEKGFPARGAISIGKFYVGPKTEFFFAGRTIVDAFELSQMQDWSGCVLTEDAEKQVLSARNGTGISQQKQVLDLFLVPYPVPIKVRQTRMLYALNWCSLSLFQDASVDVRQFVYSSFAAHNKAIDSKSQDKADKTEAFVRYVLVNLASRMSDMQTKNAAVLLFSEPR